MRDDLGTPLVTSVFHADRWEYVFTLQRRTSSMQSRKLTVFFEGDTLVRLEGDELPSETEFVATLGDRTKASPRCPSLEATERQLARHPARPGTGVCGTRSGSAPSRPHPAATRP